MWRIKINYFGYSRTRKISIYRLGHTRTSQGIILAFDLTDKYSFENLTIWLEGIKNYNSNNKPIVLFGNKSDCKEERKVSEEEARKFVKEKGLINYFENSYKENINIKEGFFEISNHIYINDPSFKEGLDLRKGNNN